MALVALSGAPLVPIGPGYSLTPGSPSGAISITMDAAEEAIIFIGQIKTSDGASHTLDTSGSSAIVYRTGAVTFANAGTTVKVGIAPVDMANGPPARASNAANVISFDVSCDMTGGGGGVTANAWQTKTPTTGTKTIANGDLVAVAVQMTARAGADSVVVPTPNGGNQPHLPQVTSYTGGSYANAAGLPNCIIVFSDGAIGYFFGGEVVGGAASTRTYNSGSATKEYGQLFDLPVPLTLTGLYAWIDPDNDAELILYSDPLGTPVAERTITIDANTMSAASPRRGLWLFPTPYILKPYQKIGAVLKPGASNISAYYKTLAAAGHRIADPGIGLTGYGISRASGAFADANSGLDHYYIGLIVGAFQNPARPTLQIGM